MTANDSARVTSVVGGELVLPGGVVRGVLELQGDAIVSVDARSGPAAAGRIFDASGLIVAPGYIDAQINGAYGIDITTEPGRIVDVGEHLTRHGVTAFVPTIITCPPELREAAMRAARGPAEGAVPVGLHLEGPMLNPARRGAHPQRWLVAPSPGVIAGWTRSAGVVMVTLAPELPGAIDVIRTLTQAGVVVSIGHTDCSAEQFAAGRAAGARYVTHLFNAMRPFGHRDPGPIGAALGDDSVVAGLICDGIHVDPVAVRMAWRALGPQRLNLVTDAVAALGGDGARIGSVDVAVSGGEVRAADGVLAGSVLSLDQALRNLVVFTGCAVPDAVATVTSTPADVLRSTDRGRLVVGGRADITVLDPDLRVVATVVGGVVAWRS